MFLVLIIFDQCLGEIVVVFESSYGLHLGFVVPTKNRNFRAEDMQWKRARNHQKPMFDENKKDRFPPTAVNFFQGGAPQDS